MLLVQQTLRSNAPMKQVSLPIYSAQEIGMMCVLLQWEAQVQPHQSGNSFTMPPIRSARSTIRFDLSSDVINPATPTNKYEEAWCLCQGQPSGTFSNQIQQYASEMLRTSCSTI